MMFKVGDIVEATKKNWNIKAGERVKVIEACSNGNLGVETENYSGGHNCSGIGKDGHCWWVEAKDYKIYTIDLENK